MVSSLCSWVQFTNFSKPRPLKEAPPTKEEPPAVSTVGFLHVWIQLGHQILGFAGLEPSQLSDKQMDQTLEDLLQESEAEFGHTRQSKIHPSNKLLHRYYYKTSLGSDHTSASREENKFQHQADMQDSQGLPVQVEMAASP